MRDRAVKEIVAALRELAHGMVKCKQPGQAEGLSRAAEILARRADVERIERARRKILGRTYFSVRKAAAAEMKETDEQEFARQIWGRRKI